jgi:hypothetical protein
MKPLRMFTLLLGGVFLIKERFTLGYFSEVIKPLKLCHESRTSKKLNLNDKFN